MINCTKRNPREFKVIVDKEMQFLLINHSKLCKVNLYKMQVYWTKFLDRNDII